jgi:hypothetical protein
VHQFRMKTVPLTDDVIEWRERPHDDLVLAVAVAAWQGERYVRMFFECIDRPPPERPRWLAPAW